MKLLPYPLFVAFRNVVFKRCKKEGHRTSSDLLADTAIGPLFTLRLITHVNHNNVPLYV